MSWANGYIEKLKKGEVVQFRPKGNSMTGKINSGQLCTVRPLEINEPNIGQIVLCKVNGFQYLHLVKAKQEERASIGNNKGKINGCTSIKNIYGICIAIEN